ncbi:MAG: succinylglutamate desuccinylase/aspartoacylase family protein [Candidatus Moranbacteria bacterium]|nr:succinylglutamate desuccinylase/aspartoacylase family protein [Candidatus Moranbacteria bacterium]
MKKYYKQILLIAATHGDERIGIEVVNKLVEQKLDAYFDFLIANPKALEKNVRYIDSDLNRSYPGDIKSDLYEKKNAVNNIKIAKKYKYVIDLHEAKFGTKNFIIIPRNKLDIDLPLHFIKLDDILLWPDPKGPLGSCLKNTIELEFGMKDKERPIVINKAVDIVKVFIHSLYTQQNIEKSESNKKRVFMVYGKASVQEAEKYKMKFKDFQEIKIGTEDFIPLLVDQYRDIGIAFYKMRKISSGK